MGAKDLYREKLEMEKGFYDCHPKGQLSSAQRILRSKLFFSYPRMLYNHRFPKQQLASQIAQATRDEKVIILNAPSGVGRDVQYIERYAKIIFGIDIAFKALEISKDKLLPSQADLLNIPFPANSIDLIVSNLFFHHVLNFGFDDFLKEFYRVLKPGGLIYILEPSVLYPINLITRPIKKWFNNPYLEVEDERPFHPRIMFQALENVGFQNVDFQAATFSHPVFFIPFANFINKTTKPLLDKHPFKYFGWLVLYKGSKPSQVTVNYPITEI